MPKLNVAWGLSHCWAGFLWPARAWFLKIDSVQIVGMHVCVCVRARVCVCVCVCVCLRPRLLITSSVMWRDMEPIQLVYIIIVNGHGYGISTCRRH